MSGAVELFVAPRNGSARRLVIATDGEREVYRDELNPNSASARSKFVAALADRCGDLDPARLDAQLVEKADAADLQAEQAQAPAARSGDDDPLAASREALERMPEDIRGEADAMLGDADLADLIAADLRIVGIAGERTLALTIYLLGAARLLSKPMAAIVQGPSSSGKSYVVEATASLFPVETVIHATSLTTNALFYMEPGKLRHRWIVAGERSRREDDETAERTRALRELISTGRLSKLVPVKQADGTITTRSIEQEGPIAYCETTTLARVFEEDLNRCFLLATDEQASQTRNILSSLGRRYRGSAGADAPRVVERHHALQRMLDRFDVVLPYADRLAESFPAHQVEARRAFPLFVAAVQACALLHQRQRRVDGEGRLVADLNDYALVRSLLAPALVRSLGLGLGEPARRLHAKLLDTFGTATDFTNKDARERRLGSRSTVNGLIGELHDYGLVELVAQGKGRIPDQWRMTGALPEATGSGLPDPDDLA